MKPRIIKFPAQYTGHHDRPFRSETLEDPTDPLFHSVTGAPCPLWAFSLLPVIPNRNQNGS